ncbi:N-6 DNA methylase [Gottfriedia acidiceleris]|uniref:N-6 DNA methylase n=1 Tax=Gottfriedia acidiceleris TaxID=371036 RepID=A0ABY4JL07_9BACI|nr:N-6 DNA methylase [Gottfriedia acidiceleris]UPM54522.1 N-6 DNA methylase [Gottfriedia acidiceleris]
MDSAIHNFWNILFKRDIVKKDELLREAIRVKKTQHLIEKQKMDFSQEDTESLFEFMKENTEDKYLGYFPGDREFFAALYSIGKELQIIDFVIETYKNDYSGTIIAPIYLTDYLKRYIEREDSNSILINEAEKFLMGLELLINSSSKQRYTLTTSNYLMYEMLKIALIKEKHIKVVHSSLYLPLELEDRFDVIISIPAFGGKINDVKSFITNDTSGIATENQLKLLKEDGDLVEIVPASFTFSSGSISNVRRLVTEKFYLKSIYSLPEGTFRPYTGIKTYILTIKNSLNKEQIEVGKLTFKDKLLKVEDSKTIRADILEKYEDWRIELILAEDKSEIKKYNESTVPKVKLNEIAEVFRGKSIMKNDLKPGDIFILNISNIEDGQILHETMETINEEERKVKRYELIENDLVITCRGTVNKVAVFKEINKTVIASANVIVIRFKEKVASEYVKIFLESPVGTELVKTFQRGTTVMNINPKDISEMEIPMVDYHRQLEFVRKYQEELELYQESVKRATERWNSQKHTIYNCLV